MKKSLISILKLGIAALIILTIGTSSNLKAADWWEKININGDFRYRHEYIDKEYSSARHRQRIRARLYIIGEVSDQTKIVMGISAGSSDPTSSNQTLTEAFSSKNLFLDIAYFEMNIKTAPGLKLFGGKMKNQFYRPGKTELIWDSDLRHEGLAVNYKIDFDHRTLQLIGAGLWITERETADNSYMAGWQAKLTHNFINSKGNVTFGASYYMYVNTKDFPVFYDSRSRMGNTVTTNRRALNYANEFRLIEAFTSIDIEFSGTPINLFGDFVTNTEADSLQSGWLVGFRIGKIKNQGSWSLRYNYRRLEADAVVGAFTNSDFGGGGTDSRGHEISGSYQLMKKSIFSVTYFNNQIGLQSNDKIGYQKWQIDLKFKF